MLAILLALFVMGSAVLLQTTIVVQMQMLQGAADLVLLTLLGWTLHRHLTNEYLWAVTAGLLVGAASQLPVWIPLFSYVAVIWLSLALQNRVWESTLLTLFTCTFAGTLLLNGLAYLYLLIIGTPLPFSDSFYLIILPSLVLNMILILPAYTLMGELSKIFYPVDVES